MTLRCEIARGRTEGPKVEMLFLLTLGIAAAIVSVAFVYTGIVLFREYRYMRRALPPRPRRRVIR